MQSTCPTSMPLIILCLLCVITMRVLVLCVGVSAVGYMLQTSCLFVCVCLFSRGLVDMDVLGWACVRLPAAQVICENRTLKTAHLPRARRRVQVACADHQGVQPRARVDSTPRLGFASEQMDMSVAPCAQHNHHLSDSAWVGEETRRLVPQGPMAPPVPGAVRQILQRYALASCTSCSFISCLIPVAAKLVAKPCCPGTTYFPYPSCPMYSVMLDLKWVFARRFMAMYVSSPLRALIHDMRELKALHIGEHMGNACHSLCRRMCAFPRLDLFEKPHGRPSAGSSAGRSSAIP